ncbi:MAG: hypothetical protein JST51_19980 [Armatimonadetes bacterium]|nr:hypothetical protein [Armatimonadota bacterium]
MGTSSRCRLFTVAILVSALIGCGANSGIQILPKTPPLVHEQVKEGGYLTFEDWHDGDKVAANKYSELGNGGSKPIIAEALRYDGKNSTFYRFSRDRSSCLVITKPGRDLFTFGELSSRQLQLQSTENLANAERILEELRNPTPNPNLKRQPTDNGKPFSPYDFSYDPSTKRLTSAVSKTTNASQEFLFEYPAKVEASTYEAPDMKGVKVFRYEEERAEIEKAIVNGVASKPVGQDKVKVIGCFHPVDSNVLVVLWSEFEKSQALAQLPRLDNSPGAPMLLKLDQATPFLVYGNEFAYNKFTDNVGTAVQRFVLPDGVSGGYTMRIFGQLNSKVDVTIPAIKKTLYMIAKNSKGEDHKTFHHQISRILFKNVPVTEIFDLQPLYDICRRESGPGRLSTKVPNY